MDPVEISDYQAEWTLCFADLARSLRGALSDEAARYEQCERQLAAQHRDDRQGGMGAWAFRRVARRVVGY